MGQKFLVRRGGGQVTLFRQVGSHCFPVAGRGVDQPVRGRRGYMDRKISVKILPSRLLR